MSRTQGTAVALWLAGLAACAVIVARTTFVADLSAFLPKAPTEAQRLLVDQLRDGVVSRLVLVAIEGGDAAQRAQLSRGLAAQLRRDPEIAAVSNGEPASLERDRALLFEHRYQLSPAVTPGRFTVEGLRAALGETIDLLASPAGLLVRALVQRDPTGELVQLIGELDTGGRPATHAGVWVSRDRSRALLLVQTLASGFDIDAQARALDHIRAAYAQARPGVEQGSPPAGTGLRLRMTGPAVFSVSSRETIQEEAGRFAILGTVLIAALLLMVYRSVTALGLGLIPVASGALAGIAAVSLGFGEVHGITLGFGTSLIGEAVDYSIYLFIQSGARDGEAAERTERWRSAFWPTIRLGVLTSIFGFAALLFSGFPGLAQLGLYSISGLIAAALVTRFVLPQLLPRSFRIQVAPGLGRRVVALAAWAPRLRTAIIVLLAAAAAVLWARQDRLLNHDLAALSPVSAEDAALDGALRADLGAPDTRYLVVVSAPDLQGALRAAERVSAPLAALARDGVIGGFESPARFLPSLATQAQRSASLPEPGALRERLRAATRGLPLRAEKLEPFVADIAQARTQPPLARADLAGSSLALAVDSLLVRRGERWSAILPLRAPTTGPSAHDIDAARVRAALDADAEQGGARPDVVFVDMKEESGRLYSGYLKEAVALSLAGALAIVLLLAIALRSMARVARVVAPLAAAVLVVAAVITLSGERLTILHLVGMLLVVAVGSNYALFFDRNAAARGDAQAGERTLVSLVFANLTTVAAFGILGLSKVPVLSAIGATVGPGAIIALVFSAVFAQADRRA